MANFFKEYHAQLRAEREAEAMAAKAAERPAYVRGQAVRINPMYDDDGNGKRYFVDYLSSDSVILAKSKAEALSGYGHIHSIHNIID